MPIDIMSYAHSYPLSPPGGLFLTVVGVAICVGAPFSQGRRQVILYLGLALATVAMALFVVRLTAHLPPPSTLAIVALFVAVTLEAALFPFVIRRLWPHGASAVMQGALALVGAHFLLMAPAFGPLVVVLGLLCVLNAAIAMMVQAIPDFFAWSTDGLLKVAIGAMLLHASPMFG